MIYKFKQFTESLIYLSSSSDSQDEDYENETDKIHESISLIENDVKEIPSELGYSKKIRWIGKGLYGVAYELFDANGNETNKVLKLTTDDDEMYNANYLRSINTKHLVNYYDVREVLKNDLSVNSDDRNGSVSYWKKAGMSSVYALVMDSIKRLTEIDKMIFSYFRLYSIVDDDVHCTKLRDLIYPRTTKEYKTRINSIVKTFDKSFDHVENRAIFLFDQVKEADYEAIKIGIKLKDVHQGNIGLKFDDDGEVNIYNY